MSAGRLSERTDLRPMAMCARDVRPGMVLVVPSVLVEGQTVRVTVTERHELNAHEVWQILGEDVHGSELAAGDVVRYPNGWGTQDRASVEYMHRFDAEQQWTRAYIDPEWERAQAEHTD